jgi:hypothetical protein
LSEIGPRSGNLVATVEVLAEVRNVILVDAQKGEVNVGVDIGGREELQHGGVR